LGLLSFKESGNRRHRKKWEYVFRDREEIKLAAGFDSAIVTRPDARAKARYFEAVGGWKGG